MEILIPILIFGGLGLVFGVLLAIASKVFFVKTEEKVEKITEALPGANCGGCGYAGCAQLAEAIANGEASVTACSAGGENVAKKIAEILGVEVGEMPMRMRAQVMCSGTGDLSRRKYIYEGVRD
ncbi:MAG: RnfABCDGE type electron transport complex subunit B [Ruminococcaceae bacterium]|nr:RnfABCDGE type electron transport complex subunit B [Oscillospiraceae bacterium]